MTVLTGRRRIGKTSLILHALKEETVVYLFVSRKSEADLCSGFCREIETQLAMFVPQMDSFIEVFFLMEQGKTRKFTLVVDEFQEFVNINESIYSEIQNYWDRYRTSTYVNFIVSGSIYSLMTKIFQDKKEPLFGRADAISSGLNTQSQIEAFMGEKSIGGQLSLQKLVLPLDEVAKLLTVLFIRSHEKRKNHLGKLRNFQNNVFIFNYPYILETMCILKYRQVGNGCFQICFH